MDRYAYETFIAVGSADAQEKSAQSTELEMGGSVMSAITKDPRGGLTTAGRQKFARETGAHLKPGVRKAQHAMTADEMRRKGSWAVRFYGRKGKLPPLKDKDGKLTRFALTAAAWGELPPSTASAARKIAAKGRKLLEKYRESAQTG